ncbi:MAG TPA: hypothetical protein VFQ05_10325 [Candidatus Eisenbacteria bacterium]|nr:hypothetical protein [Candidatus Eisenbacteria bacterium]
MPSVLDSDLVAFRFLRHQLTRRRLSQLDLRLKIELALLAALLIGFVFWQVRGAFATVAAQGGQTAVLAALTITWLVMATIAGVSVAVRHARRLRSGPPGPAWLSVPASERALGRHLAWDSGLAAGWIVVPAVGVWSAAWGYVHWGWSVGLVPLLALALLAACWAGGWAGERAAVLGARNRSVPSTLAAVLAEAGTATRARRRSPARWTSLPAWTALSLKDLRVTMRVGSVRRHLLTWLLFWTLSAFAWRIPSPPHMTDLDWVAAFILALLGSAALGEWLVSLSGLDPFQTLRSLPVGVAQVWSARFALAVVATAGLLTIHAIGASHLSPHALRLFLAWIAGATLAIAALAVNYGVTLFPRADVAQRLLGLSLGLAVAASIMIPLLGWIVLLSAVLHSARRLPHWSRLEEV